MRGRLKISVRILLLAVLFAALSGTGNLAVASSAVDDFSQVDAYIDETMRRLPIKGMAIAIVQGDQIIYQQGYGTANAQGDAATPQTPWPMASVTKSFTALAVRQLSAAGKVSLDSPVQKYLPEFQLADPHAASSVTIRDLLAHTSGISTIEGDQPYVHSPRTTFEQALKQLAGYHPKYAPGEQFQYSNINYVILGEIIARLSGMPYVEYIQQNILTPLMMDSSTLADFHSLPHAATGNLIVYGVPVAYDEPYIPLMVPAAHLTATAEDMANYLSLFFGGGQYQGQRLLPDRGQGWYDPWWNWNSGRPSPDIVYGFSGGHNSISTTCLLYPQQQVGVVILLNTRLDQLSPAVTSYDIARGIGSIVTGQPYQLPSNRGFYASWMLVDGLLLLMITSIIWQAIRIRNWGSQYRSASRSKRLLAWAGIILDLLICTALLVFPTLMNTSWNTLIALRPDFGIPSILTAVLLGTFGILKIGMSFWQTPALKVSYSV